MEPIRCMNISILIRFPVKFELEMKFGLKCMHKV